jgi:hypothetical protein
MSSYILRAIKKFKNLISLRGEEERRRRVEG